MVAKLARFQTSKYAVWALFALFLISAKGYAQGPYNYFTASPAVKGLEIATTMKARDKGWNDSHAKMKMVLRDARGQESLREMRVMSLEVEDGGDKALTIFDQPRDVAGTAFLSYSNTQGADDQWIYLPALKRVKRIASRNKSGPFMGSEFAYEDMSSFELAKYSFKHLYDEPYEGLDAYVIEQYPSDQYSGYSKQKVWIDQAHYRVHKIEFYDRKDSLLKVLILRDYQLYDNKYWRALSATMTNVQTGKSTRLETSDIQFSTGLDASDFDKNALRRLR